MEVHAVLRHLNILEMFLVAVWALPVDFDATTPSFGRPIVNFSINDGRILSHRNDFPLALFVAMSCFNALSQSFL